MLGDNIKTIRKQNGYSQETLANQLNVVRQTVSKWENGQSVPDADMLEKIANLFEVPVDELLGNTIQKENTESGYDEVAKQLAILNEQLAKQSRSRKRTTKIVLISILAIILATTIFYIIAFVLFGVVTSHGTTSTNTVQFHGNLDGEDYYYEVEYDEQHRILTAGGDEWLVDHVQTEQYDDVNELMEQLEDYFCDRGGEYQITWEE